MLITLGRIIGLVGLACLIGGMVFFATVMTPLVFSHLTPDIARGFLRASFPRYYLFVISAAAVAGIGLTLARHWWQVVVMLAIIVITVWLWQGLLPQMNQLLAKGANEAFQRAHALSVFLNLGEFLAALPVLIVLHTHREQ